MSACIEPPFFSLIVHEVIVAEVGAVQNWNGGSASIRERSVKGFSWNCPLHGVEFHEVSASLGYQRKGIFTWPLRAGKVGMY